jgi:GxxExxY protein
MIHEEVSGKIIGAAMEALNELKPGLDEKLYERALIIELQHRGHFVSVQRSFPVSYRGELIGNLIPDLIVDNAVIVDPKVRRMLHRNTYCANDWVSEHHRLGFSTPYQF